MDLGECGWGEATLSSEGSAAVAITDLNSLATLCTSVEVVMPSMEGAMPSMEGAMPSVEGVIPMFVDVRHSRVGSSNQRDQRRSGCSLTRDLGRVLK
jgi:hypothetical protein